MTESKKVERKWRTFECNLCGERRNIEIVYSDNTQNLSGEKTEYCPTCGKKFGYASATFSMFEGLKVEQMIALFPGTWVLYEKRPYIKMAPGKHQKYEEMFVDPFSGKLIHASLIEGAKIGSPQEVMW